MTAEKTQCLDPTRANDESKNSVQGQNKDVKGKKGKRQVGRKDATSPKMDTGSAEEVKRGGELYEQTSNTRYNAHRCVLFDSWTV